MSAFVLDNSVTMRWFFESGNHTHADSILRDLATSVSEATVPILWRYEVSAVLARAETKGITSALEVDDFLRDLKTLPIRIDPAGASRIFPDVHRLAVTQRLTSYDAAYLELAQRLGMALATYDGQLIAACNRLGIPVV